MEQSPNCKSNLKKQDKLETSELEEKQDKEQLAIAKFMGNLHELESALGMLTLGKQYGWRVLLLMHSKTTIRKYEQILNIDIRKEFPIEGPSAERSYGIKLFKRIGKFWKIVSGAEKVSNKGHTAN